jgi:hypothetical protein
MTAFMGDTSLPEIVESDRHQCTRGAIEPETPGRHTDRGSQMPMEMPPGMGDLVVDPAPRLYLVRRGCYPEVGVRRRHWDPE